MTIETLIYSRLQASVSGRVYPQKFLQDTSWPAIRYQLVSRERPEAMGSTTGVVRSVYQIDFVSEYNNLTTTLTTLATIQGLLERWRDSGNGIQDTYIIDEQELYDDELQLCRWSLRVEVIHS